MRDAGLSLLREVEIALHPASVSSPSRGSRRASAARWTSNFRQDRGERDGRGYERELKAGGGESPEGRGRKGNQRSTERSGVDIGRRDQQQQQHGQQAPTSSGGDEYRHRATSKRGGGLNPSR